MARLDFELQSFDAGGRGRLVHVAQWNRKRVVVFGGGSGGGYDRKWPNFCGYREWRLSGDQQRGAESGAGAFDQCRFWRQPGAADAVVDRPNHTDGLFHALQHGEPGRRRYRPRIGRRDYSATQGGAVPDVLVEAGKQGRLYIVNRDKMTSDGSHFCNGCSSDPEVIATSNTISGLWSMAAYWNGNMYFWGNGDHLKAFSFSASALSASPTSQSAETNGFPGATPVISANGTTNGIVWAAETDAYGSSGPAILRAYDATNVSHLLYGSNVTTNPDTLGPAVKFVVPVVTNGKVYVGAQKEVDVFGLFGSQQHAVAPAFSPAAGGYSTSVSVSISTTTANATIYYTTDGSAPRTASTKYPAPISIASTTTLNAIATATGFLQSGTTTAVYTITTQTPAPAFTPAPGSYTSAQSVVLTDTGATIYYTTNGSTPTHSSAVYSAAIPVSATTTIKAIGSKSGLTDSPVATGTFTINTSASTSINFGSGFSTPTGLQFNGSTDLDDSRLQLTSGLANQAGSAFFTTAMDIRRFTTDFSFKLPTAMRDGITFPLQNSSAGATALGPSGGGLGYGPDTPGGTPGIGNSIAVKFDIYNNNGEGDDSPGFYTDG